jgi:3D (Asp-Asp-Asp) domain-containing protein
MKNSTLLGSAASVLLMFSAVSYPRTYTQQQDPKPVKQPIQPLSSQPNTVMPAEDAAGNETISEQPAARSAGDANSPVKLAENILLPTQTYTATAYSLRGRTASGRPVARGLIAADPRVLPLGTRVRIDAGSFSGEYVVADTGGAVKGRRIDIWTPTSGEAMRFGRRAVKLTVLELGGRRAKAPLLRPRLVSPLAEKPVVAEQITTPKN